ncbi:MAG: hypothetical protein AAFY00_10055 [Bacteroidota bacterium]
MKKLLYIFSMLCVLGMTAQENEDASKTITVNGHVEVPREIKGYRIKATLSMDQVYYSEPTITSLQQLKSKYFKALQEAGFDASKFSENTQEFLALGYQKEGTILEYETASKEELELLSKVRMTGITLGYQFKSVLDSKLRKELLEKVFENAKENASEICKTIGSTPGEVVKIVGDHPKTETWVSYLGNNYPEYWTLSVTYKME